MYEPLAYYTNDGSLSMLEVRFCGMYDDILNLSHFNVLVEGGTPLRLDEIPPPKGPRFLKRVSGRSEYHVL